MFRRGRRAEIVALDAAAEHERIVHLLACYEFPWDMTRALEVALLRTFCSPTISGLLRSTGEFTERTQKRYDDTDLIVSEIVEHGYSSDRGRAAIARMNAIHGRFRIANEEFRYVLSTFVFEPIRWINRYAWRRLTGHEEEALFRFWRAVGDRMGIEDLPAERAEFEESSRSYERDHFRPAASNARIAGSTVEMMVGWAPWLVRPLVRASLVSMMDQTMWRCFELRPPTPLWRTLVRTSLRLRGTALRLLPTRRTPRLRTATPNRTYPDGYTIEALGPRASNFGDHDSIT